MKHLTEGNIEFDIPTAVTIGKFDGFHLGHQQLIKKIKENAKLDNYKSVVFSFFPYPFQVLRGTISESIFTQKEKKEVLESFNIDTYLEYPFTMEFASIDPVFFIEEILFKQINCKYLAIGSNYRFGKNQIGTPQLIQNLALKHNVVVDIIEDVYYENSLVSSTLIRELILKKDFYTAKVLMTKPYFIMGTIIEGRKLGRKLGFPTLNLIPDVNKLLPSNGVYLTRTLYNEKVYNSVTNIGTNPTVSGTCKSIETYLIDFNESIYGKEVSIEFIEWIRDERKFSSIEELKKQIQLDVLKARKFFD